ncbi:MAG: NUDIX domain-containing protein [Gemmatimonadaceae bacterium]|nr:NUDIX domain-containing protein [Gemmatimonadaceae bacterium]
MTELKVGVVDVFVVDPRPPMRLLLVRRAEGARCPGAWEVVHGRIESGERPEQAAVREVLEEVGLPVMRLYNVLCHPFYLHRLATVQVAVAFAAFVDAEIPIRLSAEHDRYEWLTVEQAVARASWPRTRQGMAEVQALLSGGDAGPVEDVLRVV